MATKDNLTVVTGGKDEEEGSSFGPAARGVSAPRAERRREAKETAKAMSKAKGRGPISIEELLGQKVPVDVMGDGRFLVEFYTHRFTSDLMRPIEDVEAELARAAVLQQYVGALSAKITKEKRELTEEEKEDLAEFAQKPVNVSGADMTDVYITALVGPELPPEDRTPECDSVREKGLLASWTLTSGGEVAPLTRSFLRSSLGADLVSMIIRKIRDRWTPGETKGVASA